MTEKQLFPKLNIQYREEGWGKITDEALGILPENVESQARSVARWAFEKIAAQQADLEARIGAVLEQAAHLMPRYFGVWSSTGVHIGVWDDGATAAKVLAEHPQGAMRDLIDAQAILALRPDALQALERHVAAELAKRERLFTDTSPETKWTADCEVACPCCGGSGHKDDAMQALERVRREARVEGMRRALDIVAAHGWAQQVYEELFDAIEAEERASGEGE